MPYEDSSGCLWTEHLDDEGYLFYFNEKTQVSEWELPQGAKEAGPTAPTPAALVPSSTEDTSSCWIQVLDESTNDTFFYNTSTQESTWDIGNEERTASGIEPAGDVETWGACENDEEDTSFQWKEEVLRDFQVPQPVTDGVGRVGSAQIWPHALDNNRPSCLVRWDVHKAAGPYRELFAAAGEAWYQEHPDFEPKLCFYAFDAAVEHAERYWVEKSEAPFRCRLQRDRLKFSRDVSEWEKHVLPVRGTANAKVAKGDSRQLSQRSAQERGAHSDGLNSSGEEESAFFAFPVMVHNSRAHHVDWTSGPDRYQVTRAAEPEWGWTRLFSFYAFAASKYHVLEATTSPMPRQKVVKGHFLAPERGWKCVLAFFAFDDDVPGSNRYFVEEKAEPHLRTRIGMEPSCRWEARHTFGAFDVPVQGSCAFQVHYTIRGTDSLDSQPEQSRISLEEPCGVMWERKLKFYAYPAERVQLVPAQEELEGAMNDPVAKRVSVMDTTG